MTKIQNNTEDRGMRLFWGLCKANLQTQTQHLFPPILRFSLHLVEPVMASGTWVRDITCPGTCLRWGNEHKKYGQESGGTGGKQNGEWMGERRGGRALRALGTAGNTPRLPTSVLRLRTRRRCDQSKHPLGSSTVYLQTQTGVCPDHLWSCKHIRTEVPTSLKPGLHW